MLATVTAGSTYPFAMPKKAITVTASFEEIPHTHSWTYADDSATITATCSNPDGGHEGSTKAALTIVIPAKNTYGDANSVSATFDGMETFNSTTDKTIAAKDITYVGREGTSYNESTTAPMGAGKYTAKTTVEEKTAFVDYEITKAITTIMENPTASEITYGQTLANSTLTGGNYAPAECKVKLTVNKADSTVTTTGLTM